MIQAKLSTALWVPVRVFDLGGNPVSGVASGSVTGGVMKADTTVAAFTVTGADWFEATGGAFASAGVYAIKVPAAAVSQVGPLVVGVAVSGNRTSAPALDVVAQFASDNYSRIGAPAGASIAADLAEIEVETDDIAAVKAKTDNIPASPATAAAVTSAAIASAVWDAVAASYLIAGSEGKALSTAASGGGGGSVADVLTLLGTPRDQTISRDIAKLLRSILSNS